MLSWDEAREMSLSGLVRFGSHTVNHEILDQVPLEKARDEITLSREEIEHRLGGTVRTFAYPNGNYSESIRDFLAENGFNAAVTTRKGFLTREMPLMEIPRIAIHEDVSNTIPMFRSRILLRKF
jgi:peptidoglycan/xylan/chitin deacetylase (PgdA/CDA1 family)